jgi:hypothetical protein
MGGSAISFVLSLAKWLDQRRQEREQKTHLAFHKMICLASGRSDDGKPVSTAQQTAAIYQLQNYKSYAFAALPVLALINDDLQQAQQRLQEPGARHVLLAIKSSIEALSRK